jgi:CheY-like chemotaxis protein
MNSETRISILLVDDDHNYLANIRSAFERHYNVATAPDGTEALRILRERPGCEYAVLADERMPGMTGRQLFQTIRDEGVSHLARILITGFGDAEMAITGFNDGLIDNYVEKPITPKKLELLFSYVDTAAREKMLRTRIAPSIGLTKDATMGRLVDGIIAFFRNAIHGLLQRDAIIRDAATKLKTTLASAPAAVGQVAQPQIERLLGALDGCQKTFDDTQKFFRSADSLLVSQQKDNEGTPVHDVVLSAIASVQVLLMTKTLEVRERLSAKHHFARCIPSDLYHVFANILMRAAAVSMPKDTISVESRNAEGFLHVVIRDAGARGLSGEGKPLLVGEADGVQFDLSLAPEILAKYGGGMNVSSSAGEGTTVTVKVHVGAGHS